LCHRRSGHLLRGSQWCELECSAVSAAAFCGTDSAAIVDCWVREHSHPAPASICIGGVAAPGVRDEQREPLPAVGSLDAMRSILLGLVLVAVLGIAGAGMSYRADLAEAQRGLKDRVSREGHLYAGALAVHLGVLSSELKQLSDHPELLSKHPNAELLRSGTTATTCSGGGVALLELDGALRWSEPPDLLRGDVSLSHQAWFQHALALEDTAIDALEGGLRGSRLGCRCGEREKRSRCCSESSTLLIS